MFRQQSPQLFPKHGQTFSSVNTVGLLSNRLIELGVLFADSCSRLVSSSLQVKLCDGSGMIMQNKPPRQVTGNMVKNTLLLLLLFPSAEAGLHDCKSKSAFQGFDLFEQVLLALN